MSDLDLLELKLADGTPVFVETTVAGAGADLRRVSRGDTGSGEVDRRFEEAVAHIRPAAQVLLDSLRELNTPDEINLEFGLKFNAKVGAIFASVDSEAVFKVSIKWKNQTSEAWPRTNKIRGHNFSRKAAKCAKEEEGLFRRGLFSREGAKTRRKRRIWFGAGFSLAKPQRLQRKKRDADDNLFLGALCGFARSTLLRGFASSREKFESEPVGIGCLLHC